MPLFSRKFIPHSLSTALFLFLSVSQLGIKYDVVHRISTTTATPHNHFTALFPGPPGWAGARRELLDFYGARED